MKKAAIVTWCDNNGVTNYGQILQCYAMQKVIEKIGLKTLVVNYREKTEWELWQGHFSNGTLNQCYEFINKVYKIERKLDKRILRFRKFIRKNIRLSAPCYTREDVEKCTENCDILLCGSDQIWNPLWTNPILALDFGKEKQKRIAYAPSGVALEDAYSIRKYQELAGYIERFDAIALRERKGAEILKKYSGKEITDVLDPTFLLGKDEWEQVMAPRIIDEPYIFCYTLGNLRPYKHLLKALMKRYGAKKVIYIPSNLVETAYQNTARFTAYKDAGPAEFLSLIRYAEMVCTDSFHGIALSVNMEKQFCMFARSQQGNEAIASEDRINNILEKVHMNSRKIGCIKDMERLEDIDYKVVKQYLRDEIERSWEFLRSAVDL